MNHSCPYCNTPFSLAFIASTRETLIEISMFYKDTPCCGRQMQTYIHNGQVIFVGRSMKDDEDDLDRLTDYLDDKEELITEPENTKKNLYSELLQNHNGIKESISYSMLLVTQEWEDKRNKIIERDSYRCSNCLKSATNYYPYNNFYLQQKIGLDISG